MSDVDPAEGPVEPDLSALAEQLSRRPAREVSS
jgi:hypothetical protein